MRLTGGGAYERVDRVIGEVRAESEQFDARASKVVGAVVADVRSHHLPTVDVRAEPGQRVGDLLLPDGHGPGQRRLDDVVGRGEVERLADVEADAAEPIQDRVVLRVRGVLLEQLGRLAGEGGGVYREHLAQGLGIVHGRVDGAGHLGRLAAPRPARRW
jgi:hypothetical protein